MRAKIIWALVGVNVMLGVMFLMNLMQGSSATAQARRPAEYLLIPAEVPGGASGIVYVIDMTNGGLSALAYNGQQAIDVMQPQDLDRAMGVRAGGGK